MMKSAYEKIKLKASTGLFTDYFDKIGLDYTFLGNLKLNDPNSFILGPCKTVLCEAGPYADENIELGLGYLDECNVGDVLVVKGETDFAYFGELMSRLAQSRGLAGAVILGATRDSRFTRDFLPVAAASYRPVDIKGRGRVKEVGGKIKYGDMVISEEFYLAADNDGVVFFQNENLGHHFRELVKLIEHEEMLVEKINKKLTVKEILSFTKGF